MEEVALEGGRCPNKHTGNVTGATLALPLEGKADFPINTLLFAPAFSFSGSYILFKAFCVLDLWCVCVFLRVLLRSLPCQAVSIRADRPQQHLFSLESIILLRKLSSVWPAYRNG